jgi:hypothetical protein
MFLYDSEITVTAVSGTPPLVPASSCTVPVATESKRHGSKSSPFALFLFNDYLVLAERDHSQATTTSTGFAFEGGSGSSTAYRSVTKLPLYWLSVEDGPERNSFCVARGKDGASATFVAVNESSHHMWLRVLGSAILQRQKTQVFGVPLEDILQRPPERGREVPSFLEELLAAVESEKMRGTEGIYRLSSRQIELNQLQDRLDAGKKAALPDAHTVANSIKLWLRSLPEPLMGGDRYDEWMAAEELRQVQVLVSKLPPAHIPVIAAIIQHLRRVASFAEENKMTAQNLSIVFMPTLIRPSPGHQEILIKASQQCNPILVLMTGYDQVFVNELQPKLSLSSGP